jgi:hypothetical protein
MNTGADFWTHKAAQFERLDDPQHPLSGDYDSAGRNLTDTDRNRLDADKRWLISGGGPGAIDDFKSLAGVAAAALGYGDHAEPWAYWLEYLRAHSRDYVGEDWNPVSTSTWPRRPGEQGNEIPVDHAEDVELSDARKTGQIPSLCDASARFCRLLANEQEKAAIQGTATNSRYATPFARNVDRLRTECGWTYEDLAEHVGMARSSVIGHVTKGTTPRVPTLKRYADAFAKALKRPISAPDLTADSVKPDPN